MLEAVARAGVTLGVFFQDRSTPDLMDVKDALVSGRLGRPILADARVKWYRPPEYYAQSVWRGTWALDGGGALMNQGVHTVDLLLWLLGDVRRVYARTLAALHAIEVEDTAVAVLEFASGAVATLEATTAAWPGYDRRVSITGTLGTVVIEQARVVKWDLREPALEGAAGGAAVIAPFAPGAPATAGAAASTHVVADASAHRRVFEDFVSALDTGRPPRVDGLEGRRSVALIEAIYASSRSGQPVDVTPDAPAVVGTAMADIDQAPHLGFPRHCGLPAATASAAPSDRRPSTIRQINGTWAASRRALPYYRGERA